MESSVEEDDNGRGLSPIYEVNPRVLELKHEIDDIKKILPELVFKTKNHKFMQK